FRAGDVALLDRDLPPHDTYGIPIDPAASAGTPFAPARAHDRIAQHVVGRLGDRSKAPYLGRCAVVRGRRAVASTEADRRLVVPGVELDRAGDQLRGQEHRVVWPAYGREGSDRRDHSSGIFRRRSFNHAMAGADRTSARDFNLHLSSALHCFAFRLFGDRKSETRTPDM